MFHQQEIAVGKIGWLIYDKEYITYEIVFEYPHDKKYDSNLEITKVVLIPVED
jgi:hypothetical protein